MVPQDFGKKLLDALIHLLNGILKIVLFPFVVWTNAIVRLAEQKKPIYDPSVCLSADFFTDAVKVLSYPVLLIYFIVEFISDKMYKMPFGVVMKAIFCALVFIYVFPVLVIVARYAIKLALVLVRALWVLVVKFYNFLANPHWHIAIKHLDKEEK